MLVHFDCATSAAATRGSPRRIPVPARRMTGWSWLTPSRMKSRSPPERSASSRSVRADWSRVIVCVSFVSLGRITSKITRWPPRGWIPRKPAHQSHAAALGSPGWYQGAADRGVSRPHHPAGLCPQTPPLQGALTEPVRPSRGPSLRSLPARHAGRGLGRGDKCAPMRGCGALLPSGTGSQREPPPTQGHSGRRSDGGPCVKTVLLS